VQNAGVALGQPESRDQSAHGTAQNLLADAQAPLIEENETEDFAKNLESKVKAAIGGNL